MASQPDSSPPQVSPEPPSSQEPQSPPKKTSGSKGKTAPKKKSKSKTATEETPVLSGRMVIAMTFVLGMVVIPLSPLGRLIGKKAPRSEERASWVVGKTGQIHLTVTTADYDKLSCADERVTNSVHCSFRTERERFPQQADAPIDDNKRHILQPYRTTDNQLVLLGGLWAQPDVAQRLHEEPARGVSEKNLARFVVSCDVKFIEEWDNPLIRWNPRENWSRQGKAMIALPQKCAILKDGLTGS